MPAPVSVEHGDRSSGSSAQGRMLGRLVHGLRVRQMHGWDEGQASLLRAPGLAPATSHARPEAPGLWASAGINKQRLDGGVVLRREGPAGFQMQA